MRALKLDAGFDSNTPHGPDMLGAASSSPPPASRGQAPPGTGLRFNPAFALEHQGFRVRLLDHEPGLRTVTADLIARMYASRGLCSCTHSRAHDTPRSTIIACRSNEVVGTLTLGLDSEKGLLAEMLYPDEVDTVRKEGGRVCEIIRLAMDPRFGAQGALAGMVQVLYVLVTMVHDMTDIFIEVHPRHARFYQSLLGYRIVGPLRICPRVNAPAVLLHLQRHKVDALIRHFADNPDPGAHSLYRLFPTSAGLQRLHRELMDG